MGSRPAADLAMGCSSHEVLNGHGIAWPARLAMTSSVHVVAIAGPVVVKLYQQLTDGAYWAVETVAVRPLPGLESLVMLDGGSSSVITLRRAS